MSIITDALKLATAQEKTISKQEAEIAALKAKVESLTIAKAAADEETRIAKEALKSVNVIAKLELKEAKRVAKDSLGLVQSELKQVKAELKAALKTPKIQKAVVPTNDALGQVKRKPGRPKKVVEEVLPEVDPRQIPIPDLGSPYVLKEPIAPENIPRYDSPSVSTKGVNYEFV
jgi:vancomycin resistance protein YoaR